MGIEPTSEAWEASILPLYDARSLNKVAKADTGRKPLVGPGVSMAGMVIRKRWAQPRYDDEED